MWAIKPNGIGKPVQARRINDNWPLLDGETFTVESYQPGALLAADEQSLDPPPQVTRAMVDEERDRRIALGVTVTIDATQLQIPVQTRNELDFRNLNGLVSQALVHSLMQSPETIAFCDANNTVHSLTAAEMIELGSDVAAYVQSVYNAAWQLKSGVIPGDYADDQHWP